MLDLLCRGRFFNVPFLNEDFGYLFREDLLHLFAMIECFMINSICYNMGYGYATIETQAF